MLEKGPMACAYLLVRSECGNDEMARMLYHRHVVDTSVAGLSWSVRAVTIRIRRLGRNRRHGDIVYRYCIRRLLDLLKSRKREMGVNNFLIRLNTWWHHQMETFSALLAICVGNSTVPGEFPTQRPVTRSFDVYFDLRPNKRLSKQLWGWWFETLSCPLWRHCNDLAVVSAASLTRYKSGISILILYLLGSIFCEIRRPIGYWNRTLGFFFTKRD